MAGSYTPKRGPYAGTTFASKRQYLNRKAQDEGFTNFSQQSKVRKTDRETQEERERLDVSAQSEKHFKGNTVIDVYTSPQLSDIIDFIQTLDNSLRITINIETNKAIGESKSQRNFRGWSRLVNQTRVSLVKKELKDGSLVKRINELLDDIDTIYNVSLWVNRK